MRHEGDAIGHYFEFTQLSPYGHQQKEPEIIDSPNLSDQSTNLRWWLYTQITQDHKKHNKYCVKPFVPVRPVAYRLYRAVI